MKRYKRTKISPIILFAIGLILSIAIPIILIKSNPSPTDTDAVGLSVKITETCIYKNGSSSQLSSITLYENGTAYGKQCPTTKWISGKQIALSAKRITRSNVNTTKKISFIYTYKSGSKTYTGSVSSLGSSHTLAIPQANGYGFKYSFK